MEGEASRDKYFARAEVKYQRELAAIWRKSLAEIRAEMSAIYEKYAQNGILTRAEMTRYNRLTTLEKNIQAIVKDATKESVKVIQRLKPEQYGEAFFRTAQIFDNAAKVALSWGPLDKNAVAASLENPFLEEAVKKALYVGASDVRTAINNGLAMGQSYTDMMADLKGMVNRRNFETMRILRTELHDAQEKGTMESYKEALDQGIEGRMVWIATLDNRTRPDHAEMDGVEAEWTDPPSEHAEGDWIFTLPDGSRAKYPGDPGLPAEQRINCRCTVAFQLTGYTPGG